MRFYLSFLNIIGVEYLIVMGWIVLYIFNSVCIYVSVVQVKVGQNKKIQELWIS